MKISAVIPYYNGKNIFEKNIQQIINIFKKYHGEKEIIIIDDFSTDNSNDFLNQLKNNKEIEIKVFKNNTNLGFSKTVNKGVEQASGEIIILLNTDVAPSENFLEPLLMHFKDDPSASSGEPEVFAVGCLDKSIEKGKIVERGRGLGDWKRGFLIHRRGEVNKISTLWVSGGSGAFRKSIWDKLGGLNELYSPFYYEDIDLSYRALKSGYTILFEPKSIVTHEHEKGAIKNKYSEKQIKQIAYRNQFIFVWENATDIQLQAAHFIWLPYHFAKALFSGDWAFIVGFIKALILLPQIIESSLRYQKTFVKKDKEVIEEIL